MKPLASNQQQILDNIQKSAKHKALYPAPTVNTYISRAFVNLISLDSGRLESSRKEENPFEWCSESSKGCCAVVVVAW
jgi:hypothetical protein